MPRSVARAPRIGLALIVLLGVMVIWLPPRPPMIDLPQHAGQIALLKDLALGRSPWAREIRVDLFAPYLIGYGLALPLALVMPVTPAMKVVLTGAYAAFGVICIGIRRELKAAPQLDPYYFISFFGLVYAWGLYTFLVAAPVGLGFVWLAMRFARQGGVARGLWLAALGLALLFSHGLIFLFAFTLGAAMLVVNRNGVKAAVARAWPFAIPFVGCAAFYLITQRGAAGVAASDTEKSTLVWRLVQLSIEGFSARPATWQIACLIILAALPFVGGLKFDWRRAESLVIAAAVIGLWLFGPDFAWSASGIYWRFGLFLAPAYAWLFSPGDPPPSRAARLLGPRLGVAVAAVAGFILAQHLAAAARFAHESRDFDQVMAAAAPGQRALSLIFAPRGEALDPTLYLHFPLWYQAEKHGLVDRNFAGGFPAVARFKTLPSPIYADDTFQFAPQHFDWRRDDGARYRYFFIRRTQPIPASLFVGAQCPPVQVAASGPWVLLENRACQAVSPG